MATPTDEDKRIPKPFIWRRLHSILGLWLVIYLFEHLLVNAQSALYPFNQGSSFIWAVNQIQNIPFLKAVEILLIAVPFLFHGIWGIYYALTSKGNAHLTDGTAPALPHYRRNKAYSLQRITSWVLLVGITAHVVHMRFLEYPQKVMVNGQQFYAVRVQEDRGLAKVMQNIHGHFEDGTAFVPSGGAAFFLIVRETFKNPILVVLYSIFVIAACYHAFNGVWTFMITWGVTLTRHAQHRMKAFTNVLMAVVTFLGLAAAWGTYWTLQL